VKLYTAKAVGEALGLTTSEIRAMEKDGVIEKRTGRLYCLEDTARAAVAYYKNRVTRDAALDYSTERAMLMRAKRIAAEHELDLQEGQLHTAEDVEQTLTDMLLNFRARLLGLPAKLAPKLAEETEELAVYEALKEAMDDALNELSDYDTLFQDR
jgi:hypothetical protein